MSCQSGNLVASVWRDRKLVYVMSTNSDAEGDTSVQRKERDGSAKVIPCPPNVVVYNKYMGGVDKSDQLRHYYRVRCKTRKFYRYIFWFMFDSSVVNAFILCKGYLPVTDKSIRQLTIKNFRLSLADGLIGTYNSRQRYALPAPIRNACLVSVPPAAKRTRTDSSSASTTDGEGHFPIRGCRSKCAFCWNCKDHRRNDTFIHCRKCGKALCVVSRDPPENGPSCFERYHTRYAQ